MKKVLLIILVITGVLLMLKPVSALIKDSQENIIYRGNVVTGTIATDNGNGSYDVYIGESAEAYPNIFTLAENPDLAVGDKVRILYENGIKELPIILPPRAATTPDIQLFEYQPDTSVGWANINRSYIYLGQHFTVESNHTLEKIALYLLKYNNAQTDGTAYIDIYNADANGYPTGGVLATISVDTSLLPPKYEGTDWDWSEYTLDSSINLTSGSEIVIVVRFPSATYTKTVYWGLDVPTDGSGRGIESTNSGASWVRDIGGSLPGGILIYSDFTFKIYGRQI